MTTTTNFPSDEPIPPSPDSWWYALAPGEAPAPGFQRNPRMCDEGHHWARHLDRRQGRPRYRCPAHDPKYRPRTAPMPSWQRRSHLAVPGDAINADGRMPVFTYVSVDKTPAYLRAVEAMAELGREFHLQVRPEQVRDHLLRKGVPVELADEASSEATLEQLVDWGNLEPMLDTTEAVRVADFDRRRLLYQLTHAGGLAHEAVSGFVLDLAQPAELSRTRLAQLETSLRGLAAAATAVRKLEPDIDVSGRDDVRDLRQHLNAVLDSGKALTSDARAFFTGMRRRQADWAADENAFRRYKTDVIRYIRDFVQDLAERHDRLRELRAAIEAEGTGRIVHVARAYDRPPDVTPEQVADDEAATLAQWAGLGRWIDETVALVRAESLRAVLRVEDGALRIADARQQRVSRHHDWLQLARWFDDEEISPDCAPLAASAFGPGAWFNLGGDAGADAGARVPWRADVDMQDVIVRPATQAGGVPRGRVANRTDYRDAQRRAREEHRVRRLKEQRALARVANRGPLALSSLAGELAPVEFEAIVDLLLRALQESPHAARWHARSVDGTASIIVRPAPPGVAVLRTRRGRLRLADLVIEVQSRPGVRREAAS